MTSVKGFLIVATLVIVAFFYKDDEIPKVIEQNWGSKNNSDDIRSFTINISDEILTELKHSLRHDRLTKSLPSIGNEFGINLDTIKEFKDYWLNVYDWRKREKYLNKYQQYITTIEGLDIHFVHVKPKLITQKKIVPVLIMHGWPGTFSEFYNMIPKLNENDRDFSFDVVVPSMPGFFFSDTPEKLGFTVYDYAHILLKLMQRLGYDQFYLYGTDWGSIIVRTVAILYPDNVLGVNTPLCMMTTKTLPIKHFLEYFIPDWIMPKKTKNVFDQITFGIKNTGYFHFQATYPDVLGLSFSQSPLGFLAHFLNLVIIGHNSSNIYSKDPGFHVFEKDVLLDQVMILWATDSIGSSMRIYTYFYEVTLYSEFSTNVPFSCPIIKNEIFGFSDWVLSSGFKNIVQRTYFNNTGHFYGLEKDMQIQASFANDFVEFVGKTIK